MADLFKQAITTASSTHSMSTRRHSALGDVASAQLAELEAIKIKTMYQMVEDIKISDKGRQVSKKLLFLTTKQGMSLGSLRSEQMLSHPFNFLMHFFFHSPLFLPLFLFLFALSFLIFFIQSRIYLYNDNFLNFLIHFFFHSPLFLPLFLFLFALSFLIFFIQSRI